MKLFSSIAAAAVIGASFVVPNPAEAKNGWIEAGCGSNNEGSGCYYYRVLSRSGNVVTVEEKTTFPSKSEKPLAIHKQIDCSGWRKRTRLKYDWGWSGWDEDEWRDILPGTIADGGAEQVC